MHKTKILVVAVAVALALACAAPAGAQQYPIGSRGCVIRTSSFIVGRSISFACVGFRARAVVRFSLLSVPGSAGTTTAGADGSVDLATTLPNVAPGNHSLEVTGEAADGSVVSQSVDFRVNGSGQVVGSTDGARGAGSGSGSADDQSTLPRTGAGDGTEALARVGAAFVALGGCLVLATRKRRLRAEP